MLPILFATTNQGKFKEVQKIFEPYPVTLFSLNDFVSQIPLDFEVKENGQNFKENAIIKARIYGSKAQILTISEDSGLEIDALSGRPGIHSHRYGETDLSRNQKVLEELQNLPDSKRTARFHSAMALFDPVANSLTTVSGFMEGKIAFDIQGEHGFGYDPIFIYKDGRRNAEMSSEEKNKVSHRGQAFQKLIKILEEKYF